MSWLSEVNSDVFNALDNFIDEVVEQAGEGDVETSLLDFSDSYHHENHVDKAYSLKDAADLLSELSEYEETDSGLWHGQDPQTAVATQAAFTYGNAVLAEFADKVGELNDNLNAIDAGDNKSLKAARRAYAWLWVYLNSRSLGVSREVESLVEAAKDALEESADFSHSAVLCDYLEERDEARYFTKEAREYIRRAEAPLLEVVGADYEKQDGDEDILTACECGNDSIDVDEGAEVEACKWCQAQDRHYQDEPALPEGARVVVREE